MITPLTIQKQVKEYLPSLTDLFSDKLTGTGTIIAGTPQILRITSNNHGLVSSATVVINNSLVDNSISSVSKVTFANVDYLRVVTLNGHDLTMSYDANLPYGTKVELRGFTDVSFNGYFTLENVIDKNTFDILYTSMPILNGNEVLREIREIGLNGVYQISNVSTNSFDILLTDKPAFSILPIPQLTIITSFRISTSADYNKAQEIYTKQGNNNYWLFVIMEDSRASKDRTIQSDAYSANTMQNELRVRVINRFSLDIFIPTKNELAGADAMELCWNNMLIWMLKIMHGVNFESLDNSKFLTSFLEHGQVTYNGAYYVHAYTFEYIYDITDVNAFTQNFIESRALRQIYTSFAESENGSNVIL
jgi:hypothetical protein